MITEDYCSFEVAKLLKEKGFDEICYACYEYFASSVTMFSGWPFEYKGEVVNNSKDRIKCPTHQMAMKWLREVHKINIEIYVLKNYDKKICEYSYTIMDLNFPGSDDGIDCCNRYKTYEQACEESIKYCLKHLI